MKLILGALIIGFTLLNAQIIEVSQLFNKKLVKVQKEEIGTLKSFYGTTALNETKTYDIVTRFDGYITNLKANEKYMNIKKGSLLFTIYSDEVNSIQEEIQLAKKFNKSLVNSNIKKIRIFSINSFNN